MAMGWPSHRRASAVKWGPGHGLYFQSECGFTCIPQYSRSCAWPASRGDARAVAREPRAPPAPGAEVTADQRYRPGDPVVVSIRRRPVAGVVTAVGRVGYTVRLDATGETVRRHRHEVYEPEDGDQP
jgi:hypothetical protein